MRYLMGWTSARVRARLLGFFLCFVAGAARFAASGRPQQEQNLPVLRVSTRLVQVNVVAENRKGEPITGLTRDDFTLWDNGREQQISIFSVQSSLAETSPVAAALPPHTYSNRAERASMPNSVTVILLDGLNTHFEDQVYAKAQVVKFLQQIHPQDRVAIYTLGANLKVLHDFTSDARSLLAALARYVGQESPHVAASEPGPEPKSITVVGPPLSAGARAPATATVEAGLDEYLRQTAQQSADFYSMDRTLRTLSALEAIANRLARVPGRKNLVWLSASFPFIIGSGTANFANVTRGQRSFGLEIERTERALNNANLAIYPVDARGLIGPYGADLNLSAARSVEARAPDATTIEGAGQITPTQDTMEELANRTGGRAFYGSNDILGAVRRSIDDSELTYILAYYPSNNKWDGSFHEIKVKVKGGGRVLCRRGYFALAEKASDDEQRQSALREAALSPVDATALELTVRADPETAPGVLDLTVSLDPKDLALEQQSGRWVGSVEILFAQLNPAGQIVKGLDQPMSLRLTPDEYQQILKSGLSISGRLQMVDGAERLRVVARDGSSGGLGSVEVPLERRRPTARRD